VPYKGTAAVMQEVLSGRVAMGFADLSAARGQIGGGKVRVLAVAAKKRLPQLPEVPTFEELGYPDFEVYFWQGLAVPAGTPREIVNRLSAELVKTLHTPDVAKRFTDSGMELGAGTPDDMARTIREDQKFWVPFVKSLGISVD
jgi:tripartite-type tricarboxylate transporter receptor subunit TctC